MRRALVCLLIACGPADPFGTAEPFQVRGGQFFRGPLPTATVAAPAVTFLSMQNAVVLPGQAAKRLSARANAMTSSLALALSDSGTGYWVVPLGPEDPQYGGEFTVETSIDFGLSLAEGAHVIRAVPIDEQHRAGAEAQTGVCVASRIPDNQHVCNPKAVVPDAVISLQWDARADVDLVVTTPDGREVSSKRPTVVPTGTRPDAEAAVIDRDSLFACQEDGLRQEDLVFQKRPTGAFRVAASLFDLCQAPGVRFRLRVYEAEGEGPERHLTLKDSFAGQFMPIDANGGRTAPLFITTWVF